MRYLPILIVLLLAACSPAEQEVLTTSVDVAESQLPSLLTNVDALTDDAVPVDELIALAAATPMDDELEQRFTVTYQGAQQEVQVHVWREQVDWVHLYFSSTSKDLITAIEATISGYAFDDDG
jgi:hypothetical protein